MASIGWNGPQNGLNAKKSVATAVAVLDSSPFNAKTPNLPHPFEEKKTRCSSCLSFDAKKRKKKFASPSASKISFFFLYREKKHLLKGKKDRICHIVAHGVKNVQDLRWPCALHVLGILSLSTWMHWAQLIPAEYFLSRKCESKKPSSPSAPGQNIFQWLNKKKRKRQKMQSNTRAWSQLLMLSGPGTCVTHFFLRA